METRLPNDKLQSIQKELSSWFGQKKATKKEILSLVALLQHATKVLNEAELLYLECTGLQLE